MMPNEALEKWIKDELPKLPVPEMSLITAASLAVIVTAAYRAGDCAGVKRTLEHVADVYTARANLSDDPAVKEELSLVGAEIRRMTP